MPKRRLIRNSGILVLLLLSIYVLSDLSYRLYAHSTLRSKFRDHSFWAFDAPLYILDTQVGYKYNSNSHLICRHFDQNHKLLRQNTLRVNNFGHLSPRDDYLEKSDSEFRIAILGDSFTACRANFMPWPILLEDSLNTDDKLKHLLGKPTVKVINFGMDGTGIVQWPSVYAQEAERFRPDLIIVNFITDDISRKFIYVDSIRVPSSKTDFRITLLCTSLPVTFANRDCVVVNNISAAADVIEDKLAISQVKREIYDAKIRALPWFSPYPELLALTGKFGFTSRLDPTLRRSWHLSTPTQAISIASASLRSITSKHPKVLILHHPILEESLALETPQIVRDLMNSHSDLEIETMLKFLPARSGNHEIKRWFIPNDGHPSDYGCQLYAQAVHDKLRKYFAVVR